jgi:hypothetical protein
MLTTLAPITFAIVCLFTTSKVIPRQLGFPPAHAF